ncbi:MAG: hypothetical protein AAB393_04755, partial [Bacteroidota bacterium]
MRRKIVPMLMCSLAIGCSVYAGEKAVVSLRGFCDTELRKAGIEIPKSMTFHVKAVGGGGDYGWTYKSDEMFAYGWIISADTRKMVWQMDVDNTSRTRGDRKFDDNVTLEPGSYEVYFTVPTFSYHTTFTHININIDQREKPLFGPREKRDKDFFGFFKDWWNDDVKKEWEKRCDRWGMEMLVDEAQARNVKSFIPPKELSNTVLKATGLGEKELMRRGFEVVEPTTIQIYALGEGRGEYEMFDHGWIVNAGDRSKVWEMADNNCSHTGGTDKNMECTGTVALPKGDYVVYCVTDDSHSPADWNSPPPYDPLNWGITISVPSEKDRKNIKLFQYVEDQNVIVALTKVRDDEHRSEGFTLKEDTKVRVYAFGELGNSRRSMADYGAIID